MPLDAKFAGFVVQSLERIARSQETLCKEVARLAEKMAWMDGGGAPSEGRRGAMEM